jgi:hypothetical protein
MIDRNRIRSRSVTRATGVLLVAAAAFVACQAAGTREGYSGGETPAISGGGSSGGASGSVRNGDQDKPDASFGACASSSYAAKLLPASVMFVLDKSGTMAQNGKYAAAQTAIAQAMDDDAFDALHIGLLGYPTQNVAGPACLFGFPVLCGVSGLPQVPLALAGKDKAAAGTGVRHSIYQWLASNAPQPGNGDANPTYDALKSGITALKGWTPQGKRVLFYITDGGASCASLSSRPGYKDGNGCNDWEYPSSIIKLVQDAHDDAKAPVNTIVVGVPGADSHGESQNVPPFSVRLALSAYAAAGSPETIPPQCTGKTFTQSNTDPQVPCHFDMTQGNYSAQTLAAAIAQIRGQLLGCVFEVPQPENGAPVDTGAVNVHTTVEGTGTDLYRRKSASNDCANDGCWDYTDDGKIELIGKACSDAKKSDVKVDIVVGCATVVK